MTEMWDVLDENGNKIGKSEGNAVWIDKNKTSSYDVYQYFVNTPDSLVIDYLKIFTFLSKEEIEELEESLAKEPKLRQPAKRLAEEVVKFIHSQEDAEKAKETADALFGGGGNLDNMPTVSLEDKNISVLDAIVLTGIAPSKGQARNLISQGGISLNDEKVEDINYVLSEKDFTEGHAILKKGKKVYFKLV